MAFQIVKIPDLPLASEVTSDVQYPVEFADGTKRVTQSVVDAYNGDKFIRKDVNDSTTGVITAGGFTTTSTIKFKENIQPLGEELIDRILALVPVSYNFKADSPVRPNEKDIGLIAEDVLQHLPEIVTTDSKGNLSVDYTKLSVLLLIAVKSLKK